MKFENINGIFFDVGWTLLTPKYGSWHLCSKFFEFVDIAFFKAIPQARREAAFGLGQEFLKLHEKVDTEEQELVLTREFIHIIGDNLPELNLAPEQIDKIAWDKVYNMENYVYFDDAVPLLKSLRGKYRLGVISDTWPSITHMLDYGGLTGYFDTFTYSCAVGASKPDRCMYEDALNKLGLPAEQTIFIDDIESNLDGAAACGINPVLITFKPGSKPSEKYPSISRISQLAGLL
jgi:haloacid dehalogenase superfamily, subfamily IA, variant 3 with third motif having DD or ED/haloacid dehalogenase superfamily, subfamily IA, variant 1 with third motif having Dx(3-4)D or Dx(3-4)E